MKKILFVDDEPNVLAAFERQLRNRVSIETALGPVIGLEAMKKNWRNYSVVVVDMRMPGMDGVEFLAAVKDIAPDVVRIMLTGNAEQITAIEAVNQGHIFRFLTKPCPQETLQEALSAAVRQHELITAEKELLENTLLGSIKVLTDILSIADPKAFEQAEHLKEDLHAVARTMKVEKVWAIEAGTMLANIGIITIPPEVLLKSRLKTPLTPQEQAMFTRLPEVGAGLVSQIPRMEEVSRIILYQNKHFDGSGYPINSVSGAEIPFGARLFRLLSDLRELETANIPRSVALRQLKEREGCYDPLILDALRSGSSASPVLESVSKPPISITFAELRAGHLLRSNIETKDGLLIVTAGHRITAPLIERLRNFAQVTGIREPILIES
jgi:response regulator RpfG family c-di-GMP phosphodiesterase